VPRGTSGKSELYRTAEEMPNAVFTFAAKSSSNADTKTAQITTRTHQFSKEPAYFRKIQDMIPNAIHVSPR
jgi:hypothetical protein